MEQFQEEHEEGFPGSGGTQYAGFPDNGDGRYSAQLTYKQWIEYNSSIRAHQNFVEYLPFVVIVLSVGGIYLPKTGVCIGILIMVGRLLNACCYSMNGPSARMLGAVMGNYPMYAYSLAAFAVAISQVV